MLKKLLMTCVAVSAFGTVAGAQTTKWDRATASGNGCLPGTMEEPIIAGDEIAWVFGGFDFELVQPAAASKFCRLSARATIAKGFYVANLKQELSYSGIKSGGSRISVSAASRFFGFNLPQLIHSYPVGSQIPDGVNYATSEQSFLVIAPPSHWCQGANPTGLFQSTLTANGQVLPGGGSAAFAVQGHNVTFKAVNGILACPPG